jgi:hypothetical protein
VLECVATPAGDAAEQVPGALRIDANLAGAPSTGSSGWRCVDPVMLQRTLGGSVVGGETQTLPSLVTMSSLGQATIVPASTDPASSRAGSPSSPRRPALSPWHVPVLSSQCRLSAGLYVMDERHRARRGDDRRPSSRSWTHPVDMLKDRAEAFDCCRRSRLQEDLNVADPFVRQRL